VTVSEERRYEPNGKTRRRSPASRLFSVLVVLCLIAFLILVGIVAYQLLAGSALFS
jgi:hypothetical protein